ncbi:MAG TPA: hypothetical protein DCG12_23690 [Planctomycetaceae bacterium]|mgnify:FL=1|nr:hypothetical protein [Planctomycetaceae bacterium]
MKYLLIRYAVPGLAILLAGCADAPPENPTDDVPDVAAEDVPNGFLGIKFEDESTSPLKVAGTVSGSGAEAAGLRAGDLLLQVGKVKNPSLVEIFRILEDTTPDDELPIVVERDGTRLPLKVKLMSAEDVEAAMQEEESATAKE